MGRIRAPRYLLALICLACALWALAVPAWASGIPSAARRTVRVGYFQFDGYHMISADGERSGYGYELIQGMARYNDWDVVYVGYDKSWSEMQDMLADGQIDLMTSAQRTPAREGLFDFSSEDVGTSLAMLTTKSGDSRYVSGDYATYDGMRVGMIEGNSRNDDFVSFAAGRGFSYTPVYFDSISDLRAALQDGTDIDAALTSSLRTTEGEWILEEFDASPFFAIVRKGDSELLSEVNNAIMQLDLDTPGWRTTLSNRYYSATTDDELSLNASERSYLQSLADAGEKLSVAVNPDDAPYSYLDSSGRPAGVFPTVFEEMAARLGLPYEYVSIPTRDDYDELVREGGADVVIDSTLSLSGAESIGYEREDSYLSLTISRLSPRNLSTSPTRIAVPQDILRAMRTAGLSSSDQRVTFVVKGTVQECVDSVRDGSCDAAYLYTYTARELMNDDERNQLTVMLLPDYAVDVSLAVSSRLDARLTSSLDKAGHSVGEFARQSLLTQGVSSETRKVTFLSVLYDNPLVILAAVAAVAVLVILALVVYYRSLEAQRERRKNLSLQENAVALSNALDQARRANAAKSTFLSSMSHDMRTPLNGILGFTDLALRSDDEVVRQDYLEKIKLSGNLMLALVNDTLDLSKIESGKMTLRPEVTDAEEVFDGVLSVISVAAEKKHVNLVVDTSEADFCPIRVDRSHFQQIFLNLLSNAVKYTPEGGTVTFRVRHLATPVDGCNYLVTVRDTGIGIGSDFLPDLFQPFTQEHSKEARNVEGTGLGLSIVKSIVELMQGKISVASEKGEGTTFSVLLPIERVEGEASHRDAACAEASLAGMRVLLCEDNDLNAEIATALLSERGIGVARARDGEEGLAAFSASETGSFSAILMDLRMPFMDGYEAARRIRALDRPDATTVPIIAMSADAYDEDVEKCLAAGMNGHVAKPVDPERLFAALSGCGGGETHERVDEHRA